MPKSRRDRKRKNNLPGGGPNRSRNGGIQSVHGQSQREAATLISSSNARAGTGDLDGAIADYERAIGIDQEIALAWRNRRNGVAAYAKRGNAKTHGRDYCGARNDYERAIDLFMNPRPITRSTYEWYDYSRRGDTALNIGDFDGAIADFERAIALVPAYGGTYGNRGLAKHYKGDQEGAIMDCEFSFRLCQRFPDFVDEGLLYLAHNTMGLAKCSQGDYEGAIAEYGLVINLNPNFAVAYSNRGIAKHRKGQYDGAIADFDRAIELDADYANAYQRRGEAKERKGDREGARADCLRASALRSNTWSVDSRSGAGTEDNLTRANAKLLNGDYHGAIADLDLAIPLDPSNALVYGLRGDAKDAAGDYHGAISDYDHAITLDPDCVDAYYNRGVTKSAHGDYDGAIADFDRTIALSPASYDAYNNRGLARLYRGDPKEAIDDFDHAIALVPNLAEPYYNRGEAKTVRGYFEGAVADYNRSIALNTKDDARDYYRRALAKDQRGDPYSEVMADFDRALDIDPDLEEARYNRGVVKWNRGDLDGAIADFDRSRHPDPRPDYALRYYHWGTIYAQSADYDEAVREFDRAVALNPTFAVAYFGRGNAKAGLSDYAGAKIDLDQAIALEPDNARAFCNRGGIKAEQGDFNGATQDLDQAIALGADSLLGPQSRRTFYNIKESAARALERERLQLEHNQLLEAADREIAEKDHSYDSLARERDQLADEIYRLRAWVEELTKALVDKGQTATSVPLEFETVQVRYYHNNNGRNLFQEWLDGLALIPQKHIWDAIDQMRKNNFGDAKSLRGSGLLERRLDSGLRIYYVRDSRDSVLVLGGGDKTDQQNDVATSAQRLADWRQRHPK